MSMNDGKNRIATNRIRRAGAKSLDLGKITVENITNRRYDGKFVFKVGTDFRA